MKEYKIKKLIAGHLVDKNLAGRDLIAVPEHQGNIGSVNYNGRVMNLTGQKPVKALEFPDKFGRGTYNLKYFIWQPERELFDA